MTEPRAPGAADRAWPRHDGERSPPGADPRRGRRARSPATAWLLLVICLAISFAIYAQSLVSRNEEQAARDAVAEDRIRDAVQDRLDGLVAAARGAVPLAERGESIAEYAQAQDPLTSVPGLVGLLVVADTSPVTVAQAEPARLVGEARSTPAPFVDAIAPTLLAARAAGAPRASGPFTGPVVAGGRDDVFAVAVPFEAEQPDATPGWVVALVDADLFVQGVVARASGFASLDVVDATGSEDAGDKSGTPLGQPDEEPFVGSGASRVLTTTYDALGRDWRLQYRAFFNVEDPLIERARNLLLGLGIFASFLIFLIARMVRRSEIRAHRMVDEAIRTVSESEERFRALVQDSNDMVLVVGDDGTLVYASPAGERLLGYRFADLAGTNVFELVHPDDLRSAQDRLADLVAGDRIDTPLEFRARRSDGSYVHLEAIGTNQIENPAVGGLVVHCRDVTERKRAERALRAAEERFRTVVESTNDLLFVVDDHGRITFASPSALQTFGFDEEIANFDAFSIVHPDDQALVAVAFAEFVAGERSGDDPVELRARHTDGHWIDLEIVGVNLRDNSVVRGILVSARDVTERKKAEAELHAAQERFRSAFESAPIGMFLAHPDGRVFRTNAALGKLLGCDGEALHNLPVTQVLHPQDAPTLRTELAHVLSRDAAMRQLELRLRRADGAEVWGAMSLSLVRDDSGAPMHLIGQVEDITERNAIREQLWRQSHHDALCGLPNRLLFMDRVDHALQRTARSGRRVAVAFVDLDHFKNVNDGLGHAAGDRLLQAVADRFRGAVRPSDTVARFGGDEFVVLCEDVPDADTALEIGARLHDALDRPVVLPEEEVYVTASIGVALSHDDDTPDRLVRDADTAMYEAKDQGRARTVLFDEREHARAAHSLQTGTGLHRAVERGELRVLYQPIVELETGRLSGFEALARWEHPTRGLLDPSEFLALAEETGLIVPIGAWVLETACRHAAEWNAAAARPLTVGVNLSQRQLVEPSLVETLARTLDATNVDPDVVWLEITETMLMRDPESATATMAGLRALGVHLGIDDFGTGYSSLSMLKRCPVEGLKVDRTFVAGLGRDPEDTAIVTAVVSLAHALGLGATAEGVETLDQLAELRTLGCELAQGFLFGHPLTPEEVAQRLDDPEWAALRG